MDKAAVSRVAQGSLKALSDTRVMIPADGNDAVSELKMLLRGLITGQLMVVDAPKPPEDPGDANGNGADD